MLVILDPSPWLFAIRTSTFSDDVTIQKPYTLSDATGSKAYTGDIQVYSNVSAWGFLIYENNRGACLLAPSGLTVEASGGDPAYLVGQGYEIVVDPEDESKLLVRAKSLERTSYNEGDFRVGRASSVSVGGKYEIASQANLRFAFSTSGRQPESWSQATLRAIVAS